MFKLIRNRAGLVLAALVAALCPMLMAPTGGLPARPQFSSVTVQNSDTTGSIVRINQNNSLNDPLVEFDSVGVNKAYIGVAGTTGNLAAGSIAGDVVIRTQGGNVRLSTNSGASSAPIAPVTGTYTGTFTGCTAGVTETISYTVLGGPPGGIVIVGANGNVCTSNATSFSITGAPASIRPSTGTTCNAQYISSAQDNGAIGNGTISVSLNTAGTLQFQKNASLTGWTAAGTKGDGPWTITCGLT